MHTTHTDTYVVDAIATMLGTSEEWNGADMLETIADLVGLVRPHPGNTDSTEYAQLFAASGPGRFVIGEFDNS